MDPLLKTVFFRCFGLSLWAFLSAWLFVIVEDTGKNESDEKFKLLRSLYESMASKYNMTVEEFNNFSNMAHEALSEPKPKWTYFASVDFVFQAITTVGYGYITPQTPEGQLLCIFVSLIGIPINLLALKSLDELIAKRVTAVVKRFETKILKRPEPKRMQAKSAVVLFSLMLMLIVGDGLIMIHLADWSFIEGVYFWFVTFTTIGFGDYVLYQPHRIKQLPINRSQNLESEVNTQKADSIFYHSSLFTFYFMFCLCIVSSVLNSIMVAMEATKCHRRCPGCVSRKTQVHADNEENSIQEQRSTGVTCIEMVNVVCKEESITSLSSVIKLNKECQ